MAKQIPLLYPVTPAMGEEDFQQSPSNEAAVRMVTAHHGPGALLLLGPRGTGKSHLAQIWMKRHNAKPLDAHSDAALLRSGGSFVWEDADKTEWNVTEQESAFHVLNLVREECATLLITATEPPAHWPLTLADLRSRLLAIPVAQIETPDDTLTAGLLLKHLNDRQLRVSEDVLNYLVTRTPRDGAAIADLVDMLDKAALAEARALTVPFIKSVMGHSP